MIVILGYHSVSNKDYLYATSPEMFAKQLDFLAKRYEPISVQTLFDLLTKNQKLKKDYVVITFDDGLEDNYLEALPILKKKNIPAAIFVTTGFIGKKNTNSRNFEFNFLSADQLKILVQEDLITLGSHTDTHLNLIDVPESEVSEELTKSNKVLSEFTSKGIEYFAYPKGRSDKISRKIAGSLYKMSFGAQGIIFNTAKVNLTCVPRVIVYKTSFFWFKLKFSKFFLLAKKILRKK